MKSPKHYNFLEESENEVGMKQLNLSFEFPS